MGIQIQGQKTATFTAEVEADAQTIFEAIGAEFKGLNFMEKGKFAKDIQVRRAWSALPPGRRAVWCRVIEALPEVEE